MNRLGQFLSDDITLGNIAEGQLEKMFQSEYPALVKDIKPGEKGSIDIKIVFNKISDDPEFYVKAVLSPKYPKKTYTLETQSVEMVMDEDSKLKVKPKEQPGLF